MFEAEWGHEVWVANPRQLELMAQDESKDDPVEAELLARLGRVEPQLLSPIVHGGAEPQADWAVIRARDAVVAARTQLMNHSVTCGAPRVIKGAALAQIVR